MSKIEEYHAAKETADRLGSDVSKALGRDPDNNQHRVSVWFTKLADTVWSPMLIAVQAMHGYSGSGLISDTSIELGEHLATAITEQLPELLDRAVVLAKKAAEQARLDALEEATAVLEACR